MTHFFHHHLFILHAMLTTLLVTSACERRDAGRAITGGNAQRGKQTIVAYGCGACHAIPGIRGARGTLAQSLTGFSERSFIAGELPNRPDNLVRWLMDPPAIHPNTAMPNLGLGAPEARDVAAYLYALD